MGARVTPGHKGGNAQSSLLRSHRQFVVLGGDALPHYAENASRPVAGRESTAYIELKNVKQGASCILEGECLLPSQTLGKKRVVSQGQVESLVKASAGTKEAAHPRILKRRIYCSWRGKIQEFLGSRNAALSPSTVPSGCFFSPRLFPCGDLLLRQIPVACESVLRLETTKAQTLTMHITLGKRVTSS